MRPLWLSRLAAVLLRHLLLLSCVWTENKTSGVKMPGQHGCVSAGNTEMMKHEPGSFKASHMPRQNVNSRMTR